MTYAAFLLRKSQITDASDLSAISLPSFLYDFQAALVEWALRRGRAAIFADCGLGKTPMQLVWADQIIRHTNRPVLICTPLAVGQQLLREAAKFQIEAHRVRDGRPGSAARVIVTNYERLEHFAPADFAGMVCDESSILKNFQGVRRRQITEFMRQMRYRLLCTATAAPNDYTELGTSSEALGHLGHMDMLTRFFRKEQTNAWHGGARRNEFGGETWRFKRHAREPFWRWVSSWARACRKPSDLGYDDQQFILPPLHEREHIVAHAPVPEGMLFAVPAVSMRDEREERRRTLPHRCQMVADLATHADPALIWCHLNAEGDQLERMIPDALQVSGDDDDECKEERLTAFALGQARVLITKPKIGAWGLNLQHCAHVLTFPSHSYEQYYQSIRRCWRYGQARTVQVDMITTSGERRALANLQHKQAAADQMFTALIRHMNTALHLTTISDASILMEVPPWLRS